MPLHRRFRCVPTQKKRIFLLFFLLLLLGAFAAASLLASQTEPESIPAPASTAANLYEYTPAQVASITIRRGNEAPWTVTQVDGLLTLEGEGGFTLSESTSSALLDAACILPCEAVLTDDPAEYQAHLDDFGLDTPRYEATVAYTDGVTAHLSIGDPGTENNAWYYMIIEGDDRLFTFSRGMVEALFVSRDSLWDVESPTIHKARIDRLTLTGPSGVEAEWTLQGDITDADAADKWRISAPFSYPADAGAMATLLSNASNLRLGAYVCPATPENLAAYGFDAPRLTIDIHMAAGTIGVIGADGAVVPTDFPESTVTFVIGGEKNDMVDYVLFGDTIYISSHFTMGLFIDYNVTATMSRYPVATALGNLASLTISESSTVTEYVLTRTEQVAANNELITDEDGNPVWDVTVTRNNEPVDYTAFETTYNKLAMVTVSGTLPEGQIIPAPHTIFTFNDVDGTVYTVALADFDVLHDAVIVDGHPAFYLIKGGFRMNLD